MSVYSKEMIKICKASNGYIIEVCVPMKKPEGKNEKGCGCLSYEKDMERQFVEKTEDDVAAKIKEILPKLDGEYTSEKEFEKAFGEATMTKDEGYDE